MNRFHRHQNLHILSFKFREAVSLANNRHTKAN